MAPAAVDASSWRSPGKQIVVVAGVTWVFEGCCGHHLEFLKIVKQTSNAPYGTILRDIVAKKGVIGMFDGFVPWGTLQAVFKGGVFGLAKALMDRNLQPAVDSGSVGKSTADSVAGALAGGVQGYVLSPTLLLKTRVMTDPVFREKLSPVENISKSFTVGGRVIRDEGLASLMKGANIFALKRVFDWGTRFAFSNAAEDLLFRRDQVPGAPKKKITYTQGLIASTIGGTLSAASTVPLDVLVANIQGAGSAGKKVGALETFMVQYREGGFEKVFGFATRGFALRWAHVTLTTIVIKNGTQACTDYLENRRLHK